ncbi:MAG: hypothetical protein E6Q50_13640 [Lysobacter sp.]|nr:MAG: hypothetical protein E6Q50_13640 [Lysobacter sp.]
MKKQAKIAAFLKSFTLLSWACFLMTAAGVVVAIYAWLPLASHSDAMLIPMPLASMAIMFAVFVTMAWHHWTALKMRGRPKVEVSLPAGYWFALFASLAYLLIVLAGVALYYPQNTDPGVVVNLRVFSSALIFMNLGGLGFAQWAGLRLRAYYAPAR